MNKIYFLSIFFFPIQAIGATEVGVVSSLKGECFVTRAEKKIPLVEGSTIYEQDKIETKENAALNILYDDNSLQSIASETAILIKSVSDINEGSSYFTIVFGTLKSVVGKRKETQKYEIEAGDVSLGIRGTALQVSLNTSGEYQVTVFEGNVEIKPTSTFEKSADDNKSADDKKTINQEKSLNISAGEKTSSGKNVTPLSAEEKTHIAQKEVEEKATSIQSSNEAQSQSSSNEVAAVVDIIKEEVSELTASHDAVKQNATAIESKEDQLDKGRSLFINLNTSVKSIVKDLEDIR